MAIDFTAAYRCRRLVLAASAVLVAGGLLLPLGGSTLAQVGACPTSSSGGRTPSQVNAANRTTILQLHNQYRNEVGVPPLAWDDSLADAAQRWADITAPLGQLCHDPNRPNDQGENLADWHSVTNGVMSWYNEKSKYDSNPASTTATPGPSTYRLATGTSGVIIRRWCGAAHSGSAAGRPLQHSFPATSCLPADTPHQATSRGNCPIRPHDTMPLSLLEESVVSAARRGPI